MKKMVTFTLHILISLIIALLISLSIDAITQIGIAGPLLSIGVIGVIIALLDLTRNQQGITVGVGLQQNPISSSVLASLNTSVESDERTIDLNRFSNEVHTTSKLMKLILVRSTFEYLLIGLILLPISLNIYMSHRIDTALIDVLANDGIYHMNNLDWGTSLDDVYAFTELSSKDLWDETDLWLKLKPDTAQYISLEGANFEPIYTFNNRQLSNGIYMATIDSNSEYARVTEALTALFKKHLPSPTSGNLDSIVTMPDNDHPFETIYWTDTNNNTLALSIEPQNSIRVKDRYLIILEVSWDHQ